MQQPSDASLRVRLLGRFEVRAGERLLLDSAWNRRKAKALLKLLALQPGHSLHREQALDALWPELDPAAAANNLHKNLHYLRVAFREQGVAAAVVRATTDRLALSAEIAVDVDRFCDEAELARVRRSDPGLYEQALGLYTGELLPEDRYDDWTEPRREQLQALQVQLLSDVAQLYEAAGQIESASERLCLLLQTDALNEEAHCSLMRLYALAGSRHRAIRQYQTCCEILRRELGVAPSPATDALYRQIIEGRISAATRQMSLVGAGAAANGSQAGAVSPGRQPPAHDSALPGQAFSNLPAAMTSFIGRTRELSEVTRLLATTRLLTLTGAGGSGKTRLALEVARADRENREDGVWLAELAALSDPGLIPETVASVFGIRQEPGPSLSQLLVSRLRSKRLLLLLDNCEHLITACAEFTQHLLCACPNLSILATSREALGVPGEVAWLVPSLSLPEPEQASHPEALLTTESVQLLVERARARQPAFQLTEQNAPAVVQVCCQLDGIPLALELAAARLAIVTVQQLAARLGDRFRLLVGGSRTALPRQQTLRATLEWSYDLLTGPEQAFLRSLSIFPGSFSLEAAEAVGGVPHPLSPEASLHGPEGEGSGMGPAQSSVLSPQSSPESSSVLDLLGRLVGKSLLLAADEGEAVRYRFLETVQEYGRERLRECGELAAVEQRLVQYCLALVKPGGTALSGSQLPVWLQRLDHEHDTMRAALRQLAKCGDARQGLQLATALRDFWDVRGHLSEGRAWIEEFLSLPEAADPPALRGGALQAAAFLAFSQGDAGASESLSTESLVIFRELGDQLGTAESLYYLSLATRHRGDYVAARLLAEESLSIARVLGNSHAIAIALRHLGKVASRQEDRVTARALYDESLAIERRLENSISIGVLLSDLAELACGEGDFISARSLYEESLRIGRALASRRYLATCLEGIARVDSSQGDGERATRLLGAASALREVIKAPLPPFERLDRDNLLALLQNKLSEDVFAAALADGRAIPLSQAIAYALHELAGVKAAS